MVILFNKEVSFLFAVLSPISIFDKHLKVTFLLYYLSINHRFLTLRKIFCYSRAAVKKNNFKLDFTQLLPATFW